MAHAALIPTPLRAVSPTSVLRGPASASFSGDGAQSGTGKTFRQVFRAEAVADSASVIPGTADITTKSATASLAKEAVTSEGESAKAEADTAVDAADTATNADGGPKLDAARLGFIAAGVNHEPQAALKSVRLTPLDSTGASRAVQDKDVSGEGKCAQSGDVDGGDANKSKDEKKSKDCGIGWKSAGMAPVSVSIQGAVLPLAVVAVQAAAPSAVPSMVVKGGTSAQATENSPHTVQAVPVSGLAISVASGDGRQAETVTESPEKPMPASDAIAQKEVPAGKSALADGQSKVVASPVAVPVSSGAVLPGTVASNVPVAGDGKAPSDAAAQDARSVGNVGKNANLATQAGTQGGAQLGAMAASTATPASSSVIHSASSQVVAQASGMAAASAISISPYARMDQSNQAATPVVLHSGAQQVAVGVQDASLGWVEIRTQNISGHVDATLVAASGVTQSALAAQLPAMAQFVAQHDVRLGSLAVQQAASNFNSGLNSGTGFGSGSGQNGPGQNYPGQSGGNPSGGFTPGALMGGSGNPAGGSHSRSARSGSGFSSGRSVGGVPAAGVPAASSSYGDSEDAALRPVSYISVRV